VIVADPRLQSAGAPYTAERLQAIQDGLNDRPGNASASYIPANPGDPYTVAA